MLERCSRDEHTPPDHPVLQDIADCSRTASEPRHSYRSGWPAIRNMSTQSAGRTWARDSVGPLACSRLASARAGTAKRMDLQGLLFQGYGKGFGPDTNRLKIGRASCRERV